MEHEHPPVIYFSKARSITPSSSAQTFILELIACLWCERTSPPLLLLGEKYLKKIFATSLLHASHCTVSCLIFCNHLMVSRQCRARGKMQEHALWPHKSSLIVDSVFILSSSNWNSPLILSNIAIKDEEFTSRRCYHPSAQMFLNRVNVKWQWSVW